jgi:hypothetical protein
VTQSKENVFNEGVETPLKQKLILKPCSKLKLSRYWYP